jgi:uncharacterized protein YqgQ
VKPYWRVKDMLSAYKGIIYMGDRLQDNSLAWSEPFSLRTAF